MTAATPQTVQIIDPATALEATFAPAAGMVCCSLRHRGEQLLAGNAGLAAYAERGKTMGIPLLYPWANRLAAFEYAAAGPTVPVPHDPARIALDNNGLPIHGVIGGRIAWDCPAPASSGGQALRARLRWSELTPELFSLFPFVHELEYEAVLDAGRLTISVTVTASGADAVPLAFGFHPYLTLPGAPRERWLIELPAMRQLVLDARQIPIGHERPGAARSFELGAHEFDDGFDSLVLPARFAVAGAGRRLTLEFLEGYTHAQVYAPLGGEFICFEPMAAPTNALRSGDGLRLLAPGESQRLAFSLKVEDLARR